jgi:hypothetical protein
MILVFRRRSSPAPQAPVTRPRRLRVADASIVTLQRGRIFLLQERGATDATRRLYERIGYVVNAPFTHWTSEPPTTTGMDAAG